MFCRKSFQEREKDFKSFVTMAKRKENSQTEMFSEATVTLFRWF